jgi:pentose-5-phosphate-3-epimerase
VHLDRTLHLIASHGCKPGVVINPATQSTPSTRFFLWFIMFW